LFSQQQGRHVVKKLALLTVAAAALLGTVGGASAQIYYSGPGYGVHIGPRYEEPRYYRDDYRERRHHRRYARQRCPYMYTVQDGVCKPYRGY
jgi:hypothetical protein